MERENYLHDLKRRSKIEYSASAASSGGDDASESQRSSPRQSEASQAAGCNVEPSSHRRQYPHGEQNPHRRAHPPGEPNSYAGSHAHRGQHPHRGHYPQFDQHPHREAYPHRRAYPYGEAHLYRAVHPHQEGHPQHRLHASRGRASPDVNAPARSYREHRLQRQLAGSHPPSNPSGTGRAEWGYGDSRIHTGSEFYDQCQERRPDGVRTASGSWNYQNHAAHPSRRGSHPNAGDRSHQSSSGRSESFRGRQPHRRFLSFLIHSKTLPADGSEFLHHFVFFGCFHICFR